MNILRVTFRAAAISAATVAMSATIIVTVIFLFPFEKATARLRVFFFRCWAKMVRAILGLRIDVRGAIPPSPFFLVSNHLSYVDIIALASQVNCVFIAKSEVARWPVIGLLCRAVGTIFIDRTRRADVARVNKIIERKLARNQSVVLFAEGTSTEGAAVLPFKSSLLEMAARADFKVSYAAISYKTCERELPAHLSVCWWGEMTFFKHFVALLKLREVRARVAFGPETVQERNRKRLALKLWEGVTKEFTPVIELEGKCTARTI